MALKNLVPGQYQLGDLVFGRGTNVRLQNFEVLPYDVAAQEMQVGRSDLKRFGFDQLTPTTINITMGVLRNYIRKNAHNPLGITDDVFKDFPKLGDIRREWRDPAVRAIWGQMKPLYVCGQIDGITRIVWGRPGQFTYARPNKQTEWLECLGEFRCADTVAYRAQEMGVLMSAAQPNATLHGTGGDARTWIRVLFAGPVVNPKLMIGSTPIELNYTIAPGEVVEVSGYPWSPRIVNNANPPLNLSRRRTGGTPYLDKLFIEHDAELALTFTGTGMNANSGAALCFHDAYEIID